MNKLGSVDRDLVAAAQYVQARLDDHRITLDHIVKTREEAKWHLKEHYRLKGDLKWLTKKLTETLERTSDYDPDWISEDDEEETK